MPGSPSAFHPAPHLAGAFPAPFPGGGVLAFSSLGSLWVASHPTPISFPLSGLPGFPCFLPGRLRGFTTPASLPAPPLVGVWIEPFPLHELRSSSSAFASWESRWGRPRASPSDPRAKARAPRTAEARALGRALGLPGEGSADPARRGGLASAPVVFPGGTKSPRVPPPWDPRNSRFRLEWGAGNAAWKLWGPGPGPRAISGLRRHRRSRLDPCTSESYGLGLCFSLRRSSPPVFPAPTLTGGRPGGAAVLAAAPRGCVEEAAAARRRGWLLSLVI